MPNCHPSNGTHLKPRAGASIQEEKTSIIGLIKNVSRATRASQPAGQVWSLGVASFWEAGHIVGLVHSLHVLALSLKHLRCACLCLSVCFPAVRAQWRGTALE